MPQVKCPRCANVINQVPGVKTVCNQCGYPGQAPAGGAPMAAGGVAVTGQKKGMGIAGMVLGIIGACLTILPFAFGIPGFACALVGVVLSAMQLSKIKKEPSVYGGKGIAITGLVLSIVAIVFGILWILVIAALVGMGSAIADELSSSGAAWFNLLG